MASPIEWRQPQRYQLSLWLFSGLAPASKLPAISMAIPQGGPSLRVSNSFYGYSYGVAPASEIPAVLWL